MTDILRLALVTDIHHGPTRYTKLGAEALPLLESFRNQVTAGDFDLVVDLGDRITNVDRETDLQLEKEVEAVFAQIDTPRAHLLGNHDLHYLTVSENEAIWGRSFTSYSTDLKGHHLVFWQLDLSGRFGEAPLPSQSDLDWLRDDLACTKLPAIIFTHVPMHSGAMTGNFYFHNNGSSSTLSHTAEARQIIEAAGNVVLCLAGHVHWNDSATIDGIRYLTLQSLTESYTTQGEVSGAWAEIEIDDSEVRWRAHGGDPLRYEAPLRGRNMRWVPPLPPFPILRAQENIADFDAPVRGVILDMDGVLYLGNDPIDGSSTAVAALHNAGLRVVCLTNNARHKPEEYAAKLASFGIRIDPLDIITSGQAVVRFLTKQSTAPKVHIAGSDALRQMLLTAGAVVSDTPDYVVAGIDLNMTLADLTPAIRHIANGAQLIGSNGDAVIPTADGPEPEAGSVVAFLETATGSNATLLGKPKPDIYELALERLGLHRDEVIAIGDTFKTDIAGATASSLRSVLVASGNSAADEAGEPEPTMRFADLSATAKFLTMG